MMHVRVTVTLRHGVLDPQGQAIEHALMGMGFGNAQNVRQSKLIEFELDETNTDKARSDVERMCNRLLANTVIEEYQFELGDTP